MKVLHANPSPSEKLDTLVGAYLDEHTRHPPKYIAMTKADYRDLEEAVNKGLAKELHYKPSFYHGIPIIVSVAEKETVCLPR